MFAIFSPSKLKALNSIEALLRFFNVSHLTCYNNNCPQVLQIHPDLNYNVHFPIKRGELNVHSGIGGSLTAVLTDLQEIWSWTIRFKLNIPITEFKVQPSCCNPCILY